MNQLITASRAATQVAILFVCLHSIAYAQQSDSLEIERLKEQVEAITRQIEQMQLGQDVVAEADTSVFGFGPAASKVYRVRRGVSVGGYGEVLYENFATQRQDGTASDKTNQFDALRAVVYIGYKFNDRIIFNSETEFEHAATDRAGSVAVEFAYLDFLLSDGVGIRTGLVLTPMGLVNEQHEPPTFLGTERPTVEQRIIPSTWRENGVGLFAEFAGLALRSYVINGLDAIGGGTSKAKGFDATGLRNGRQKGSKAVAENMAGVLRLDYVGQPGLLVGSSVYYGKSGQGNPVVSDPSRTIDAETLILEGHAQYRAYGFDVRGLFALATVDDVAEINEAKGYTGNESVGERQIGWYVQLGYDVFRSLRTNQALLPYVRYERVNTQDRVPAGFSANPATDVAIVSLGAAWKPISSVIVKADYQLHRNESNTGVNQFNLSLGYLF
jgi:hypothetical protein